MVLRSALGVMRRWIQGSLFLATLLGPLPAQGTLPASHPARGTDSPAVFRFEPALEVPLFVLTSVVWLTPELLRPNLAGPSCDPCDPDSLNWLDRPVVDYQSEAADVLSDVVTVGVPALAAAGSLLTLERWGWGGVAEDLALWLESLALSGVIYRMVSLAVRRPRPFMYVADKFPDKREDVDANLSFFSGHSAATFSTAAAFATCFTLRHPDSPWVPWVWTGSMLAASSVPVFRAASGEHFWTDVLAGSVAGAAVGIIVPYLHHLPEKGGDPRQRIMVGPGPGAGLAVTKFF